ncbi:unnamed protein product, partial [Mesorhabditis belari]|uniref:Uncharacterized protein n=1 Tax=Mesorhabditis belari TaxID=2138241 RepID=A0AAF3FBA5_9BILA
MIPELYLPAFCGKFYGISYTVFGLNAKILQQIGTIALGFLVYSTTQCVFYRHQQLLSHKSRLHYRFWKNIAICIAVLHYIGIPSLGVVFFQFTDYEPSPQAKGLTDLLEKFPEYIWVKYDPDVLIAHSNPVPPFQISSNAAIFVVILFVTFEVNLIFGLLFWHAFYLLGQRSDLSERTKFLHRKMLFALFVQICVPFLTIAIPWALFAIVVETEWRISQDILNLGFLMSSLHAMISSICICLLTKPYKR